RGQTPGFALIGLGDRACQEAKERVRGGFSSSGLEWPSQHLTVNLAPAALRKEGAGFDLPIALAVLAASGQVSRDRVEGHAADGARSSLLPPEATTCCWQGHPGPASRCSPAAFPGSCRRSPTTRRST